uniref:Innexin n=1 Tax=Hirondellea gigas TaxID=1518452 RepID=A0A2P2I1N6_9CRUS
MALVDIVGAVHKLLKLHNNVEIDGAVFKLHYRVTSTILISFCLLVTCTGLLGKPIHCAHGDSPYLQDDVVNTFCWIHSTFTLPRYFHGNKQLPYPGVGPGMEGDEVVYHAYYQWVPFMLFLQGLFFYVPHWLWKTWEGGKMNSIAAGLSAPIMSPEDRKTRITHLKSYICMSLHSHNMYASKFFICEILNFINVLGQMYFLNKFLGGLFLTYGMDVINFTEQNQSQRSDPMIVVFPRVTKCSFEMFGPSGSIVTHDLMCILALNVINEKIYVFLWFWFVILTTLTCIAFLYRILVFCVPIIRSGLLQKRGQLRHKVTLEALIPRLQFGDYFLLYLISKNVEGLTFHSLLEALAHEINESRKPDPSDPETYPLRKLDSSRKSPKEKFTMLSERI